MFINKNAHSKKEPEKLSLKENELWNNSRRKFIKLSLLAGALSQLPFATSCVTQNEQSEQLVSIDGKNYTIDLQLIRDVQDILFPKDELGPGALELKSDIYLLWVLNDHRLDPWDGEYILKGFRKLDKASKEHFDTKFVRLSRKNQEELIARLSVVDWAQDWLSKILTLIFESMFANPNYGSNPDSIGWKWLNHHAGFPQPDKNQIYPTILEINKQKYKS